MEMNMESAYKEREYILQCPIIVLIRINLRKIFRNLSSVFLNSLHELLFIMSCRYISGNGHSSVNVSAGKYINATYVRQLGRLNMCWQDRARLAGLELKFNQSYKVELEQHRSFVRKSSSNSVVSYLE